MGIIEKELRKRYRTTIRHWWYWKWLILLWLSRV